MLNPVAFRRALLRWYSQNGRDLPWRRTRDPYAILVSEVMLQQTQVATVVPYYNEWLRRFPSFGALAQASENDVLHAWQGLGYYARARNLHGTAKVIVREHSGRCPDNIDDLRALPGIGPYTANAVATFAFNRAVPVVEANINRVLARLFDYRRNIKSAAAVKEIWNIATSLVPKHDAHTYNNALMELGALVCTSHSPGCVVCPVRRFCRAKDPLRLPITRSRRLTVRMIENHGLVLQRGRILLEQAQHRWHGMWMLPRLRSASNGSLPVHSSIFPFTHHRVTLNVFSASAAAVGSIPARWFPLRKVNNIPMPSPHRRALVELLGARS